MNVQMLWSFIEFKFILTCGEMLWNKLSWRYYLFSKLDYNKIWGHFTDNLNNNGKHLWNCSGKTLLSLRTVWEKTLLWKTYPGGKKADFLGPSEIGLTSQDYKMDDIKRGVKAMKFFEERYGEVLTRIENKKQDRRSCLQKFSRTKIFMVSY